jgi:hypothetical protein
MNERKRTKAYAAPPSRQTVAVAPSAVPVPPCLICDSTQHRTTGCPGEKAAVAKPIATPPASAVGFAYNSTEAVALPDIKRPLPILVKGTDGLEVAWEHVMAYFTSIRQFAEFTAERAAGRSKEAEDRASECAADVVAACESLMDAWNMLESAEAQVSNRELTPRFNVG